MTTLDQRRALALRIAKTIQRDPASIVASLRARLDTTAFDFNERQPRDDHGRWTDKPGSGLGKLIKKAVSRFSPSEQEEYDKLESKLGKTGHLRGKEAERHNALRKKLHGSPSPSYDTEDEGPTHADNVARQHQLERQFESDEGLSSAEHDELKGLQSLAKDASDSDIAEFKRLENKLDNSYLTDAENARHNELRRKIEGPQRARERELDDIAENRGYVTDEEANYLNQLTDSEFANEADEFFLHGMTRDEWKSLSKAKKAVVYKNLETIDDEDLWRKFTDFEGS